MNHRYLTLFLASCLLAIPSTADASTRHLVLNGFSQEVHSSDGYTGVVGTSARTLSWWYRSHVAPFPTTWGLVYWGDTGAFGQWSIQLESFESGSVNLEVTGTKIAWSALRNPALASLQDGRWHHLVLTAPDTGTMGDIRLYLDGALVPVVSVVGGSLTNSYDTHAGYAFRVGARDLGNHSDADLDEIALWNVALDSAAVAEIFNGGIPTDLSTPGAAYQASPDLQLYWRFEEGSGVTTEDLAGNGHHGILIDGNAASWGSNPPGSGSDADGDGFLDGFDNCLSDANAGQEDADADGFGDVCDLFPVDPDNEQAQCEVHRDQALAELQVCLLNPPTMDEDGDGEADGTERCPGTPAGAPVDDAGCSPSQFCVVGDRNRSLCLSLDWRNDEPPADRPGDCRFNSTTKLCLP